MFKTLPCPYQYEQGEHGLIICHVRLLSVSSYVLWKDEQGPKLREPRREKKNIEVTGRIER